MIPLIMHQIWYQGIDNIIEPYKKCFYKTQLFLKQTKWQYIFWDKNKIEDFINNLYPKYWNLYNNCSILVQKLDIARYIILYHYGGCYMDMDVEMIKDFSILLNEDDEFVVSNTMQYFINNGIIFSIKENSILLDFLEDITTKINKFKFNKFLNINFSTGPINFTNFINKNKDKYNIKILPYKYLEPCESKYNLSITKDAFVINYYGNSWINPVYTYFILLYSKRYNIFIIILLILLFFIIRL
jgi:mannosyltransferase OCH1-like enzyme